MKRMRTLKIITALLCVTIMLAACADKNENNINHNNPAHEEINITHYNDNMVIDTDYGDIIYPYAFSDVISVSLSKNDTSICYLFTANVEEESAAVYNIVFGNYDGVLLGHLAEDLPVYIEVFDIPEDTTVEFETTFYAAQETVNDVISSIYLLEGFTPVK